MAMILTRMARTMTTHFTLYISHSHETSVPAYSPNTSAVTEENKQKSKIPIARKDNLQMDVSVELLILPIPIHPIHLLSKPLSLYSLEVESLQDDHIGCK